MKTIKLLNILTILLFGNIISAQLHSNITNKYAVNAFKKAVAECTNKSNTIDLLLTIEIKSIDSIQGEFSVRAFGRRYGCSSKKDKEDDTAPYVHGFLDLKTFKRYYPTYHYIRLSGRIVFVDTKNLTNIDFEKYGINRVTKETLDDIVKYYKSKGWDSAFDISDAVKIRYVYKGYKIQYDPFIEGWTPYIGREYWTNWKLKLGNNQEKLKQEKINSMNNYFLQKKDIEIIVRDSLLKNINSNYNLPLSVKSQNLKKLRFICLYKGYLKRDSKPYNDTTSIYPFIALPDNSFPYKVIICKSNNFWGEITFKDGLTIFKHVSNLQQNEKEIALTTFKYFRNKKQEPLFYIEGFGNRIWHIHKSKIIVYQPNKKYSTIEADEFVHRFYYSGDIIIERME
ncbi:MAG TPA: hypothetical protein VK152_07970 [Paludibacter sp.]|nr:hypothetical protein [Paludibacter sp.]